MPKYIEGKEIKPVAIYGIKYRQYLNKMIENMYDDILKTVLQEYKEQDDSIKNIVGDADPVGNIKRLLNERFRKWRKYINKYAIKHVEKFIDKIDKNNISVISSSLKDVSKGITIQFDKRSLAVLNAKKSLIASNIASIKNLEETDITRITQVVMNAIPRGKSPTWVASQLADLKHISKNRIKLIAKQELKSATHVLATTRQIEAGFTKNKWVYTYISKEPRPDHVKANGTIYDLKEGCKISGEFIQPGQLIGCNCTSVIVYEVK